MKRSVFIAVFLILVFIYPFDIYSWEPLDRVIAVVNNSPIIESEVINKFERLLKMKRIARHKYSYEKSRILDAFIENSIVEQKAEEESIIVSDKKVDNYIEGLMKQARTGSLEDFKKQVEKKEMMSFDEYKEEVRISIMKEQVIQIAIGISPPSNKEAMDWYRMNKEKIGAQLNIKHIVIRLRNNSIAEERRVNEEMNKLRKRITAGESFEELARKYSEDASSASNGGSLGWKHVSELDPYLAAQVYNMRTPGQITRVIKSTYGYHIVKFMGKRDTPFEEVKHMISRVLFQQKMGLQFKKWVVQRKMESDIRIFMEDYKG